jgi:hypothetical protein
MQISSCNLFFFEGCNDSFSLNKKPRVYRVGRGEPRIGAPSAQRYRETRRGREHTRELYDTLSHHEWRGTRSTRRGARTTHKRRWLAASDATWLAVSETLSNTMRFLDFHTAHKAERMIMLRRDSCILGSCSASPSRSATRSAAGERHK